MSSNLKIKYIESEKTKEEIQLEIVDELRKLSRSKDTGTIDSANRILDLILEL